MAATSASPPSIGALVNTAARPPSLCMKPLQPAAGPSPGATPLPVSLTTKEWIVPPRPKPGRKPATDTPPTKRKAQNRAAQRAFRERRAQRVGELEEQLREVEEQHEQEQEALRANISDLDQSLQKCQADLAAWVSKCHQLEEQLIRAQEQLGSQRGPAETPRRAVDEPADPTAVGCGNCTLDSHCQCIDDVVKGLHEDSAAIHGGQGEIPDQKSAARNVKSETLDPSAMEIDFTAAFAKAPLTAPPRAHPPPATVVADPCGFCQNGTPCICAEIAGEQTGQPTPRPPSPNRLRSHQRQMAQVTPPPSEGDVAGSAPIPRGGASGPGTCTQCLVDPNSTLFCKSLAASRGAAGMSTGCCGGRGAGSGGCQSSVPLPPRATRSRTAAHHNVRLPAPTNTLHPVTLSCADAYTALSRHAGYERATGDMASWMPKLHANLTGVQGRPAMEIDAANVMAVLKDFDRRFGATA